MNSGKIKAHIYIKNANYCSLFNQGVKEVSEKCTVDGVGRKVVVITKPFFFFLSFRVSC